MSQYSYSSIAGKVDRIAFGSFSSVVVYDDQIYSAEYIKGQIQVHQLTAGTTKRHYIGTRNNLLTLSISNNQLKCCSYWYVNGNIETYSLAPNGELLQTYGPTRCVFARRFNGAFIRGGDADGSVLIVDRHSGTLCVRDERGEYSELHLHPSVSKPCGAVLFNNHLYVTSDADNAIYRYSCGKPIHSRTSIVQMTMSPAHVKHKIDINRRPRSSHAVDSFVKRFT